MGGLSDCQRINRTKTSALREKNEILENEIAHQRETVASQLLRQLAELETTSLLQEDYDHKLREQCSLLDQLQTV